MEYNYSLVEIDKFHGNSNEDLTNLSADLYFLEITDDNSCIYYDTLEITQPPSLFITLNSSSNAICFDSCNGEINITANGGDSSYFYFWTGPNGFTSTSEDISNLCYGEYILTLDDGISSITDTFNILSPGLKEFSLQTGPPEIISTISTS